MWCPGASCFGEDLCQLFDPVRMHCHYATKLSLYRYRQKAQPLSRRVKCNLGLVVVPFESGMLAWCERATGFSSFVRLRPLAPLHHPSIRRFALSGLVSLTDVSLSRRFVSWGFYDGKPSFTHDPLQIYSSPVLLQSRLMYYAHS